MIICVNNHNINGYSCRVGNFSCITIATAI